MDHEALDADALARPGRPAQVTIAAAVLIAFGAFISLVGLALAVVGGLFLDLNSLPTWVDPPTAEFQALSIAVAGVTLAFGIVHVVGGVQALRGKSWAQVVGIVVAVVGAVVAGLGLLQGFGASATGVTTIFLPIVLAYLYAAVSLATAPGWFVRT